MTSRSRARAAAVAAAASLATIVLFAGPQTATTKAAVPVEPIAAILDAFRSHPVVAFSDDHGDRQMHEFGLAVVRDPRFADRVNDIVVETGNARYQDTMDRFIRGENVSTDELQHVWNDTTQVQVYSPPHAPIPDLYRLVREINATRSRNRQIRVLLGDPPVDWEAIRSPADHRTWIEQRDSHGAEVVRRDVIAKGRRAVVIYGQGHLQRRQVQANYETGGMADSMLGRLERTTGTRSFAIWWARNLDQLQADVASWRAPSLAMVRGTSLGALDFALFSPTPARFSIRNGTLTPIPREQWRTVRMEDQFDAVLHLGAASAMTAPPPAQDPCRDVAFLEKRLARLVMVAAPPPVIEQLKATCPSLRSR